MTRLFFAVPIALFSLPAHAQTLPIDSATGKVVYRGMWKPAPGVSPAQSFDRAKRWLLGALAKEYQYLMAQDTARGFLSGIDTVQVKDYTYKYLVELWVEPTGVRYLLSEFDWYQPKGTMAISMGSVEMQVNIRNKHPGQQYLDKLFRQLNRRIGARLSKLKTQLGRRVARSLQLQHPFSSLADV